MNHLKKMTSLVILCGLLTSCNGLPAASTTGDSKAEPTSTSANASNSSQAMTNTSQAGTTVTKAMPDSFNKPMTGILADTKVYATDNPLSHAKTPVALDPASIVDKSTTGVEKEKTAFEEYLKKHYNEQTFKVINISKEENDGRKFVSALAQSTTSKDIAFKLLKEGNEIYDNFNEAVILRQNTLNRWTTEFNELLKDFKKATPAAKNIGLKMSFKATEDFSKVLLDSPVQTTFSGPQSRLSLTLKSVKDPMQDAQNLAETLKQLYAQNMDFNYYDLTITDASGAKKTFEIPARMAKNTTLAQELQLLLEGKASNSIKPKN